MAWSCVGVNYDDKEFVVDGINLWGCTWEEILDEEAEVKDPLYGKAFTFPIFTATDAGKTVRFAAGEFTTGVWGIFTEA